MKIFPFLSCLFVQAAWEHLPINSRKEKAISDKEFDSGSKINFPALSEKTIEDLELLGKTWGFLKYHHPGGLRTAISGIDVYYPNRKETLRVGIVPDIIVKPTIEGIKKGKDELIEKAIELIKVNREMM